MIEHEMKQSMKKTSTKPKRLHKILKIQNIDKKQLRISVLFGNGEDRILDFKKILNEDWQVSKSDVEFALLNPSAFSKVKVENHTLSWDNLGISIRDPKNQMIQVPYQVGADTLYDLSEPDFSRSASIGSMFRAARLAANLSQEQVAKLAGTSRTYITKIENDGSDIEFMTLKKLVEAGLHKRLMISIQ
jgi:DNA-binding XRE family transcriptional regulator